MEKPIKHIVSLSGGKDSTAMLHCMLEEGMPVDIILFCDDIFHRVSCWCCPLQSYDELRKLRKHFPELWEKLGEWDEKNWRTYLKHYSVKQLEIRFAFEEERLAQGLPIKGKAFFDALNEKLKEGDA